MFMRLYPQGIVKGLIGIGMLLALVVVGSGRLTHFDAALTPYLIATLFAIFASIYRYSVWMSRPPTRTLWKRSLQLVFSRDFFANLTLVLKAFLANFIVQRFIGKRSPYRWIMHLLLAWGCMLAFAVTFPLVFGWLHFDHPAGSADLYQVVVFGVPTLVFDPYGIIGFMFFNALNFCSVMVITGVFMALGRRFVHPGEITIQTFAHDFLPLLLLFAVSASGLLLTFSTHFMAGQHYRILSTVHCWTVVGFLVYLPFGKFFHIFQRMAQMGAELYIRERKHGKLAICPRTKEGFISEVQKEDVKRVLRELGFEYQTGENELSIQDLSPQARRQLFMAAQHKRLKGKFDISKE